MSAKQTILHWLESGDLARAAAGLKFLAEKNTDETFEINARHQSTRLATLLGDRARGIVSEADFFLEKNKVQFALHDLAAGLPENWTADGLENIPKWSVFSEKKKKGIEKLALWLGILAAILAIAGYSLRDFFQKKEVAPIIQPAENPASEPVAEPTKPVEKPAGGSPKSTEKAEKPAKNQTNITIKDQGKAGTIITGDSNKIDIKQDF